MTWKDSCFGKPLYMNELSEGTLRFLWLVSLLLSPSLSTVTMIDEPEVSLHPELLSLLADLMREASARTQLIVATHSDRLVRFLEPKEVLVMDSDEEGLTTATWADHLDLDKWMADYTLDEVWRMGSMGGRA
jgi:predicted ATPase